MEPASPLKSITNTTQLPPSATQTSQQNAQQTSATANKTNGNSSSLWGGFGIPPPSTLRLNGITKPKFDQQFTPDDSNLFNQSNGIKLPNGNSNNSHGLLNGFNRSTNQINNNNNNNNNNNRNQNVITKNSLNLDNNNKFTPDADFVADFGSAFNGAVTAPATIPNGNAPANGLPNGKVTNGTNGTNGHENGNNSTNANENFADFDHNPIYNAAGN